MSARSGADSQWASGWTGCGRGGWGGVNRGEGDEWWGLGYGGGRGDDWYLYIYLTYLYYGRYTRGHYSGTTTSTVTREVYDY